MRSTLSGRKQKLATTGPDKSLTTTLDIIAVGVEVVVETPGVGGMVVTLTSPEMKHSSRQG